MKFNKFTKLNYNEIIPFILEANLYFSITKDGDFITAIKETLVNLLFEDFLNEIFTSLTSSKIDSNSEISLSFDFNINLN